MFTVRKMFIDCSIFMTNFSIELEGGSLGLLFSSSGEVLGWNVSSTITFSSFSFKTLAWTLHDLLCMWNCRDDQEIAWKWIINK